MSTSEKIFLLTYNESSELVFNFYNCAQNTINNNYLSISEFKQINNNDVYNLKELKKLVLERPVIIKISNTFNNNSYLLSKFRPDTYSFQEL